MGITSAAIGLARFAAAEVNAPEQRGRAISTVVFGGVVGSILARVSAVPMGDLAISIGMDELAGAYLATLVLFVIATVIVFYWPAPRPTRPWQGSSKAAS